LDSSPTSRRSCRAERSTTRSQLDKLSQQLERLEKELQQKAGQQQSGQYAQEAKALREAADQLKELQAKEQELEKRTGQLRREMQAQAQKRFEQKGGKQLAQDLQQKAEMARKAISADRSRVASTSALRGHPGHGPEARFRPLARAGDERLR